MKDNRPLKKRRCDNDHNDHNSDEAVEWFPLLPLELWIHAFGFLDVKDVFQVRCVSRFVKNCVDDYKLLKHFVSDPKEKEELFDQLSETQNLDAWKYTHSQISWDRIWIRRKRNKLIRDVTNCGGKQEYFVWFIQTFQLTLNDILLGEGPDPNEWPLRVVNPDKNALTICAKRGRLDLLQWLHDYFVLSTDVLWNNSLLNIAVVKGKLDICVWLHNVFTYSWISHHYDDNYDGASIDVALSKGYVHICKWLCETGQITKQKMVSKALPHLSTIVEDGHQDMCAWLHEISPCKVNRMGPKLLIAAAKGKQYSLCVWIREHFDFTKKPITDDVKHALINKIVSTGNLELCKWCHITFGIQQEHLFIIKRDILYGSALGCAVSKGYEMICQWLDKTYQLTSQHIAREIDSLETAIRRNHIQVCKWAFPQIPDVIQKNHVRLLRMAAIHDHVPICQLLADTCSLSATLVDNERMLSWALYHQNIRSALWLCTTFRFRLQTTWKHTKHCFKSPRSFHLLRIQTSLQKIACELYRQGKYDLVTPELHKECLSSWTH